MVNRLQIEHVSEGDNEVDPGIPDSFYMIRKKTCMRIELRASHLCTHHHEAALESLDLFKVSEWWPINHALSLTTLPPFILQLKASNIQVR
jgi:hypothetical protein